MYDSNMVPVEDYGIPNLNPGHDFAEISPSQPAKQTFSAVKIARAKTGETEIRLLSKRNDQKHDCFYLEQATICPFASKRTELKKGRKTPRPMTEAEALQAFEFEVAKKYPAVKTKNGSVVPTYLPLM